MEHGANVSFVYGVQQIRFPRVRREMSTFAKQPERHVHPGHRRAQFMGCTQDKFAAHPLEGALLGDVMQHHHSAQDMALGMTDRRQAVRQHARLAIDLDAQILGHPLQHAAAQHQLQLLVQLRAAKRRAETFTQALEIPTQLTLCHGVEVFEMAIAIDHQQAVVDTVEHRLQPLLTGKQFVDIGSLVLTQCLGHEAEALGQ
jgi:hypothetical protein